MSDLVSIDIKIPNYLKRLQGSLKRIQIAMAADIQTNRGLMFDAEGAYNGHPKWKDLKSGANKRIAKNGMQERQILRKSGALKNSIAPTGASGRAGPGGTVILEGTIAAPAVRVSTQIKYAAIHDKGGTIRHPGTANGFGKGIKIPAHDIEMPRRNFSDWNRQDQKQMGIMLKNLLSEILNGR